MSAGDSFRRVKFIDSQGDPGRAPALQPQEYRQLISALATAVVPVLERTAAVLKQNGFGEACVELTGGMASLLARHGWQPVEAVLRFQIHETFAVLTSRDPVFWMSAVYCGSKLLAGKPGRLADLDDAAAIEQIAESFVEDSLAVSRSTAARPIVSSAPPAVVLPLTLTRIRPREGCRGWTRDVSELPLPAGLPEREPVEVIASKWSRVRVSDSGGREWELSHWQVDCGAEYAAEGGGLLRESHPTVLAGIRNAAWDLIGDPGFGRERTRNADRVRHWIWILQRNGADISEFNEALADLKQGFRKE